MKQEIRFCTANDGVRLAYATAGRGAPLVKTANWLNHLEFDWESPIWRHLLAALAARFSLLRYDERGNGLSDWDVDDISFDAMVRDLETVVDSAGVARFTLFGISQGCPVSVAYAVRHPGRVSRMILLGGYARGWKRRGDPREIAEREALRTLVLQGWGRENPAFRQVFTSLFVPDGSAEQMSWFNELQRVTASPRNAVRLIDTFAEIDVTELLPQVTVPTLVLHCRGDARVPFEAGRRMASAIPGARFVALDSRNHLVLEQEPAWRRLLDEITTFAGAADDAEVDRLFERALDLPPDRRADWLSEECGDAPALRDRVEHLLELAERDGDGLRTGGGLDGSIGHALAGATTDVDLPPGSRLGAYRIVERIGRGGMGTVYRARHERLGRDVAVKAVSGVLAAGDALDRFEREAKLLARLNHPNIATVHDLIVVDRKPYLILELVRGTTLSELMRGGPLPPGEVRRIALELCDGLAEAHAHGIVHRDLKPANVMITPAGRVKVLDFGLAKTVERDRDGSGAFSTAASTMLGTPGYMSPEQIRGEPVDARADLWALGCILFEMLTGDRAFAGSCASDTIAAVLRDEAELGRLPADTPVELSESIRRCLDKSPERRPPSVDELRRRL